MKTCRDWIDRCIHCGCLLMGVIAFIVVLASCTNAQSANENKDSNIKSVGLYSSSTYGSYEVTEYADPDTGVVYIIVKYDKSVTITPKLNADGSIYTIAKE